MSYPDSIRTKEEKAHALWDKKDYAGARKLYEEIKDSISFPLDKAKTIGNIAQLYEKEGNLSAAITAANAAIKMINENELYQSLEGSHLRGYIHGFINRLQKKGRWESLPYDENISIEMNLTIFSRVRAHFSVAVISGALFGAFNSRINIPSIDISLLHEKIVVFSVAGFLFSIFFTSDLLQQAAEAIMTFTGREIEKSLKPAVNLLTVIAILYLLLMPSAFWSMASEIVFFVLTGLLGMAMFFGFMYRKYGSKIREKV